MGQPFSIAYRDFGQGGARPYLVMELHGLNGKTGTVWGLVDSGSDRTSLPFEFASLMNYTPRDLEQGQGVSAAGTMVTYLGRKPCTVVVPEIPSVKVSFQPLFIQGARTILWGRQDFMQHFDVTIMHSRQTFAITPLRS